MYVVLEIISSSVMVGHYLITNPNYTTDNSGNTQ